MHNLEGSKDRTNITNDRSRLDTQDPLAPNPVLPGKLSFSGGVEMGAEC